MTPIKPIVEELWPLHRTLVSDGTDEALEILRRHLPREVSYEVETYAPGMSVWTWRVPERYVVDEAYLEIVGGRRVVDFRDNCLHLLSYSLPIDKELSWDELAPHLHYSEKRPQAIPWEYKFYERGWGFCLSKDAYDALPRDARFRAVIRSRFLTDADAGLRVGVARLVPPAQPDWEAGEFILCAHICHPRQANDDAAGVATLVDVARRLAERPLPPGSMSVRWLFCPETIGSVSYFSQNEDLIPNLKGGLFCEMTGNRNTLALQRSRQDHHRLDRVGQYVLMKRSEEFRQGAFRDVIANDEMIINGPGVNVPCISISRWPYPEYHTSDDNPSIIHEDMLRGAAEAIEEIVRIYATDFVPRRLFRGPLFLSGHGLWVDWRQNAPLNLALEKVMLRLEGEHSVFDIAAEVGVDYWVLRDYIGKMVAKGLVERHPLPSVAETEPGRARRPPPEPQLIPARPPSVQL